MTFEQLAGLAPEEIKERGLFPYPSLPHPLQANGGQVFPQMQIAMFPRLERFDVEFDLPDAFLPEFPPAIFLQNRPELGDVSRGQVVTLNNFRALFKEILTPVQLEGMRLLLDAAAPGGVQPDRRPQEPASPSWASPASTATSTATPPASSTSAPTSAPRSGGSGSTPPACAGVFNQQIHGSKRSLRSVEDFTEFEQRTAYFNGDPIRAMKKGFQELPRSVIPHMAQVQNMLDFPPAPKLDLLGRLDPKKATEAGAARRGAVLRQGASAPTCHPAPFYLDHQMHDLHLERFLRTSRATARSRPSPCAGSRTARPTSTTAGA